jgi:hypothetical protein
MTFTMTRGLFLRLSLAALALGGCTRARAEPSQQRSGDEPPIACKLGALSSAEREQHAALLRQLGTMTEKTTETADGFALHLRADAAGFMKVAEWITLERRCCPFLNFDLKWNAGDDAPALQLGGRTGVKEFLAAEMGAGG